METRGLYNFTLQFYSLLPQPANECFDVYQLIWFLYAPQYTKPRDGSEVQFLQTLCSACSRYKRLHYAISWTLRAVSTYCTRIQKVNAFYMCGLAEIPVDTTLSK